MRRKNPPNVKAYLVRYKGKDYAYYYFRGTKVRLPGLPWSAEFMEVHAKMMANIKREPIVIGASRTKGGTVNAAIVAYYEKGLVDLAPGTNGPQRSLIERFRRNHGDRVLRELTQTHLQTFITALGSPAVQRNMLRAVRHFLKFCKAAALIATDPSNGVTRAKMVSTGGFTPWTEEDVGRFEKRHLVGSMARLALALYLNFGVRKGDVIRIGPRQIKDGELVDFQPQKTSRNGGKKITVPLLEETKQIIAATPLIGTGTYLVNQFGKPFTVNGFGNKMREWCDEAGLPEVSSHGLRKLCLIRLAEAGFSAPAIASISGHKDLREIQLYIDAADRKKLARATMAAVEETRKRNGSRNADV